MSEKPVVENDESRELTDDELMQIVGGSKLSAQFARENRGPGGGHGPWG